jgi:hypothetical protein
MMNLRTWEIYLYDCAEREQVLFTSYLFTSNSAFIRKQKCHHNMMTIARRFYERGEVPSGPIICVCAEPIKPPD